MVVIFAETGKTPSERRYVAICVSMCILRIGTHTAIYRSLWRWSLFSQTPVWNTKRRPMPQSAKTAAMSASEPLKRTSMNPAPTGG